jgi:Cu-processing system ATP-binding protein
MIRACALTKSFGLTDVLRGLDLDLTRGRITGLIGPNGSGKTTFIKILLGLTAPDAGVLSFDGEAVGRDVGYRARIGYMPQIARYPENLSVAELFALVKDVRNDNRPRDESLIAQFRLWDQFDKRFRTLSGGNKQKVNAALAFLFRPDLLILDEPTAGLDPASSATLKDKILAERDRGCTVLITSHIMAELDELCDDVVFLLDGRVRFAGSLSDIKHRTRQTTLERAVASMFIREVA